MVQGGIALGKRVETLSTLGSSAAEPKLIAVQSTAAMIGYETNEIRFALGCNSALQRRAQTEVQKVLRGGGERI